ncbi:MAG: valine--pyruvate transaminase [Verrucomicrobiota bacterium]|nr:valine--pyruvate transaminase [Verrucomicrobiota bacterium]
MEFSSFGEKLRDQCGILELMDDLGKALTTNPDMRMMGGGNPAAIPEVQKIWRDRAAQLLGEGNDFDRMLVNYDPPAGNPRFLEAVAGCLNRDTGWNVQPGNVAVTCGGQTAFFFLFNMLAGEFADGSHRKILLPLTPEYIGYANQGVSKDLFTALPAIIEEGDDNTFKYRVDFDNLEITGDIAAICVSRPTNPSGNVLSDTEIARLSELAKQNGIPLIIDNAYGNPFPGAIFTDATPVWDEHVILTLSLSKLGLPGTRTGIIVASETITRAISAMTAVVGLANNNIGQTLALPLLESGEIINISNDIIRPFYRKRAEEARQFVAEAFDDSTPYRVHAAEGAFFLWFWFPELPISSTELYRRLKQRDVLVVPGEYFFYGLDEPWQHSRECIRVTFSQPMEIVREGIKIIAEEVGRAYRQ